MKGFSDVSRAATCASGVILESRSPESVVAKRRDSVQKPYGMTSVWGGRTVNTSILSFPSVVVGNLSLFKKENDNNGSPNPAGRQFLGDDNYYNGNNRSRIKTLRDDGLTTSVRTVHTCPTSAGFTLIELLVVVLIIGILAGVALPQYQKAVAKARYTQMITAGKSLKDAMEVYYMANGDYPVYWSDLDITYPGCSEEGGRYLLWCDKFAVDILQILLRRINRPAGHINQRIQYADLDLWRTGKRPKAHLVVAQQGNTGISGNSPGGIRAFVTFFGTPQIHNRTDPADSQQIHDIGIAELA